MCRNFKVKFGTLSQPGKSGLVSSENRSKASQRKDSYGTILADLCRAVGVKVVQNLELFPDRMPVQFLCSKFRGIIRSYSECDRLRVCCFPNSVKTGYPLVY